MRLWRGRGHSLELVLAFAAVLTLGPFAQAASAEAMLPSLDGILDAVAQATGRTDPTPEPTPDPTPTPTPEPTPDPTPTPTPTPEPTPDPTPTPTPDPTPAPTPDATPTPTTGGTSGPGSDGPSLTLQSVGAGESFTGDSGQSTSGGVSKVGVSVQGGADSWIQSVASILDELAATGDGVVRAAEGTPRCPGSECGSASDAIGSGTLVLVLICAILAVAGTLAIRAGRRRSNMYSPR